MPKLGMEPIRKRQLIEATVASIHANGFADTTVQTISRAAGVSPGIIHHYFGGKGALLAATMRSLLVELRAASCRRCARPRSPRERIEAVIDASFAERQFQPQVIVTWLAFWGQAPHDPGLARLQRIYARRLTSHLRHDLRPLVGASRRHGGDRPRRHDRRSLAQLRAGPAERRDGCRPGAGPRLSRPAAGGVGR